MIIEFLREARWLHAPRARAWCNVLAAMTAVFILGLLATSAGGIDIFGKPLGTDFISFWTASKLALAGHAASAYQPALHAAAQHALFPRSLQSYAAFFYPPTFLLLCLPLALLPYLLSLAVWLLAGLAVLIAALRRLLPQRWAIVPMLAFPAVLDNLGHGQTAFVIAACFGWSAVWRRDRPFLAGICLGLLVIKPHLLLAAPILLLAGRHWRVIAGGVCSGCVMIGLSWLVLGSSAWSGFRHDSGLARATLEQGLVEPWKMQSVFAAVRLAHGGVDLAYALQGLVAAGTLYLLVKLAWRRPDPLAEGALLPLAAVLCTPFLLDYDLVCLAIPLAWIVAQVPRTGWFGWEKIVLLAAYLLPLVARPLGSVSGVGVAPVIVGSLLWICLRRVAAGASVVSLPPESCHAC
jgi:hypothetical protein